MATINLNDQNVVQRLQKSVTAGFNSQNNNQNELESSEMNRVSFAQENTSTHQQRFAVRNVDQLDNDSDQASSEEPPSAVFTGKEEDPMVEKRRRKSRGSRSKRSIMELTSSSVGLNKGNKKIKRKFSKAIKIPSINLPESPGNSLTKSPTKQLGQTMSSNLFGQSQKKHSSTFLSPEETQRVVSPRMTHQNINQKQVVILPHGVIEDQFGEEDQQSENHHQTITSHKSGVRKNSTSNNLIPVDQGKNLEHLPVPYSIKPSDFVQKTGFEVGIVDDLQEGTHQEDQGENALNNGQFDKNSLFMLDDSVQENDYQASKMGKFGGQDNQGGDNSSLGGWDVNGIENGEIKEHQHKQAQRKRNHNRQIRVKYPAASQTTTEKNQVNSVGQYQQNQQHQQSSQSIQNSLASLQNEYQQQRLMSHIAGNNHGLTTGNGQTLQQGITNNITHILGEQERMRHLVNIGQAIQSHQRAAIIEKQKHNSGGYNQPTPINLKEQSMTVNNNQQQLLVVQGTRQISKMQSGTNYQGQFHQQQTDNRFARPHNGDENFQLLQSLNQLNSAQMQNSNAHLTNLRQSNSPSEQQMLKAANEFRKMQKILQNQMNQMNIADQQKQLQVSPKQKGNKNNYNVIQPKQMSANNLLPFAPAENRKAVVGKAPLTQYPSQNSALSGRISKNSRSISSNKKKMQLTQMSSGSGQQTTYVNVFQVPNVIQNGQMKVNANQSNFMRNTSNGALSNSNGRVSSGFKMSEKEEIAQKFAQAALPTSPRNNQKMLEIAQQLLTNNQSSNSDPRQQLENGPNLQNSRPQVEKDTFNSQLQLSRQQQLMQTRNNPIANLSALDVPLNMQQNSQFESNSRQQHYFQDFSSPKTIFKQKAYSVQGPPTISNLKSSPRQPQIQLQSPFMSNTKKLPSIQNWPYQEQYDDTSQNGQLQEMNQINGFSSPQSSNYERKSMKNQKNKGKRQDGSQINKQKRQKNLRFRASQHPPGILVARGKVSQDIQEGIQNRIGGSKSPRQINHARSNSPDRGLIFSQHNQNSQSRQSDQYGDHPYENDNGNLRFPSLFRGQQQDGTNQMNHNHLQAAQMASATRQQSQQLSPLDRAILKEQSYGMKDRYGQNEHDRSQKQQTVQQQQQLTAEKLAENNPNSTLILDPKYIMEQHQHNGEAETEENKVEKNSEVDSNFGTEKRGERGTEDQAVDEEERPENLYPGATQQEIFDQILAQQRKHLAIQRSQALQMNSFVLVRTATNPKKKQQNQKYVGQSRQPKNTLSHINSSKELNLQNNSIEELNFPNYLPHQSPPQLEDFEEALAKKQAEERIELEKLEHANREIDRAATLLKILTLNSSGSNLDPQQLQTLVSNLQESINQNQNNNQSITTRKESKVDEQPDLERASLMNQIDYETAASPKSKPRSPAEQKFSDEITNEQLQEQLRSNQSTAEAKNSLRDLQIKQHGSNYSSAHLSQSQSKRGVGLNSSTKKGQDLDNLELEIVGEIGKSFQSKGNLSPRKEAQYQGSPIYGDPQRQIEEANLRRIPQAKQALKPKFQIKSQSHRKTIKEAKTGRKLKIQGDTIEIQQRKIEMLQNSSQQEVLASGQQRNMKFVAIDKNKRENLISKRLSSNENIINNNAVGLTISTENQTARLIQISPNMTAKSSSTLNNMTFQRQEHRFTTAQMEATQKESYQN